MCVDVLRVKPIDPKEACVDWLFLVFERNLFGIEKCEGWHIRDLSQGTSNILLLFSPRLISVIWIL